MRIQCYLASVLLLLSTSVFAASVTIPMYTAVDHGQGKSIGNVVAKDTPHGLLLTPNLHGLPAGVHGFHVHTTPNCGDHAMDAHGHLDPAKTDKHLGPYGTGHLGDLPVLPVDNKGDATHPLLAPRLTVKDIEGHALMIHAGGDNYSDKPKPLGGGGARIACGVIK
tara:strand:+ start:33486 stop:33983 length:498 start_codon:yes stop_codon:yes gene_type:complete